MHEITSSEDMQGKQQSCDIFSMRFFNFISDKKRKGTDISFLGRSVNEWFLRVNKYL